MTEFWGLERDRVLSLTPSDFAVGRRLDTRWRDNDAFGHVNNAVFYEYFDTALNTWLLEVLPDDPQVAVTQRFVVESGCRYLQPISYPTPLLVTHRVARLGTTSVTYELGIFPVADTAGSIAALGRWTHVYVEASSGRPVRIPDVVRALLNAAAAT